MPDAAACVYIHDKLYSCAAARRDMRTSEADQAAGRDDVIR